MRNSRDFRKPFVKVWESFKKRLIKYSCIVQLSGGGIVDVVNYIEMAGMQDYQMY